MSRPTEATASAAGRVVGGDATVPGLAVVVMAAGLGKRMKSKHPKVLHAVAGRAMVLYSIDVGVRVAGHRVAVVVGHQADRVRQAIEAALPVHGGRAPVAIVEQREQLGTGHAVLQTRSVFNATGQSAPVCYLILNGDTPLLREETVRRLLQVHQQERATVTILTAKLEDPSGYGRVVRQSADGPVSRIVEDRDAGPAEKAIRKSTREPTLSTAVFCLRRWTDWIRATRRGNTTSPIFCKWPSRKSVECARLRSTIRAKGWA